MKGTLEKLLGGMNLHLAFRGALSKLCGYTSDLCGIHHGSHGELLEVDPRTLALCLVIYSPYVNYIISQQNSDAVSDSVRGE